MRQRAFLLVTSIILISITAFAGTITKTYTFTSPSVIMTENRTYLEIQSCRLVGEPGQPALPAFGTSFLLPPGEEITSVEISTSNAVITAAGVMLNPVNIPITLSNPGPFSNTEPDPAVYGSNELFPQSLAQGVRTEYMSGYSLGYFRIHPVQYRPQSGEVSYYSEMTVTVQTAPSAKAMNAHTQMYRAAASDRRRLQGKVENPEAAVTYGPVTNGNTDNPVIPYLLITDPSLEMGFQDLIDFKNSCGYTVEVVYVSDIYSTYPGIDNQEKIRYCITDYFYTASTAFVLLGGDTEIIPHRGLWATLAGETDPDIPADLYYSALDGNWDSDGDGNYGESGESDLVSELAIGRASVSDVIEAYNFTYKQMMYQTQPVADAIETALMAGEDLGWTTWGSDLKEEIHLGTTHNPPIPNNFYVGTLYDTPSWSWSGMGDLLPLLNLGPNLVNHMGHANTTYMMKFYNSNVNDGNMTNDGINQNFYIVYSQGCYCGAYDNRLTQQGQYTSDCISEKFSNIAHGAVSMITNSRYGWGDYSGTNGPSQWYDREFFDAIFGEEITFIGETNQDSKEDNISYLNMATYWCYYQLNLFGDPTLDIWTAAPAEMTPTHLPNMFVGQTEFTVEVPEIENAYCALTNESGLLGTAYTDINGQALIVLSEPLASLETMNLAVTAHNCLPYMTEITVITPDLPFLVVDEIAVNDLGDGDGMLDVGETSHFALTVSNVGMQPAESVMAELTIDDEYIVIINSEESLGTIGPESVFEMDNAFEIGVESDAPDGHPFIATITMTDAVDSTWAYNYDFTIAAPVVTVFDAVVQDENMRLNPGDQTDLEITLLNSGSGELRGAEAGVFTDSPHLSFSVSESGIALINSGDSQTLEPPFNLTVSPDCPDNIIIPFYLELTDAMGFSSTLIFELVVGGFYDNFENGAGEWTHEVVTPSWADEWQMLSYRNHTPDGGESWHCGSDFGGNYRNNADGGLISPMMEMDQDMLLKFWHWMDSEISASYPGSAYDGGIVELSLNGTVFFPIAPIGYYPYEIRHGTSGGCAINEGQGCFAGQHDWEQAVFDLWQYPAGSVQFRFRFSSDGNDTYEGWYIDDVVFEVKESILPPSNFQADLDVDIVHLTWNSPSVTVPEGVSKGGQRDTESLMNYRVYRDSDIIADNLIALEYLDDLSGMPQGQYTYELCAVYSSGDSSLAPELVVDYPEAGIVSDDPVVPDEYFLDQNFPNPFNPETSFRFGIPEAGKVTLTVYNVTGREVAKLTDDWKPAGYYTIKWNAENMPSGIYLYRLHTKGLTQNGKMLLLK